MRTRFSRSKRDEEAGAERAWDPRVVAELDAAALKRNYRVILEQVPGQSVLPMLKADGYGHGAGWAARQLVTERSLYGFGVATLEEGETLRRELGMRARKTPIIVFSGAVPWSDEKGAFCEENGLTPVIASDADWPGFLKGGWPARLAYELKFNTGMNRLGLGLGLARVIARELAGRPAEWHPSGIFSHLAQGETPDVRQSQTQRERFAALRAELSGVFPAAQFHLANSAGIWNAKHWGLDGLTDVVRPGISLYGVPPWAGAPARGLESVMAVKASVVAVRTLKAGEGVGYGATYVVSGREGEGPVRTAVLSAGYADGVHRMLSNQGFVWLHGREGAGQAGQAGKILGRVSMDLTVVSCPGDTRVGDRAELLGPRVDIWAQAKAAGTVPYELLTSVSSRVQRIYV